MRKFFSAITAAGFSKIFWILIAVVCFVIGGVEDSFLSLIIARAGWMAVGIFIYINANTLIKYYSEYTGATGYDPAKQEGKD